MKKDLTIIANSAQSLWAVPEMMGGANRNFTNLTEEEILKFLNVPVSKYQLGDSQLSNANGTYTVEIISDTELTIKGEPISGPPNLRITVKREDTGQWSFVTSEIEE